MRTRDPGRGRRGARSATFRSTLPAPPHAGQHAHQALGQGAGDQPSAVAGGAVAGREAHAMANRSDWRAAAVGALISESPAATVLTA
jgi:hypothetical protein